MNNATTTVVKATIWARKPSWSDEYIISLDQSPKDCVYHIEEGYIPLEEVSITVNVPAVNVLIEKHIEVLRQKKQMVLAKNQSNLNKVDDEINSLLAIESKE